MPTDRRQTILMLSAGTGVLFALLLLFRSLVGGAHGEPCGPTGSCQLGLTCVINRCLPRCSDNDDCSDNMSCGIMQVEDNGFTDAASRPILVCLPRDDAERQVQRSVAGGSRQVALNQKRSETYDALQKLLVAEKWAVSDEAFAKAWKSLPESVRRERPPAVLAKLIMTTAGSPIH